MKAQNELQAMNKDLLKHTLVWVQLLLSTEMRDRINVLNLGKLSMYDQYDSSVSLCCSIKACWTGEPVSFDHEAIETR
ncbi:MAG: hypothetical protein WBX81_09770 [Nitrososphaeraceae archaeon]